VAPVLVLIGVSMMGEAKEVLWWNMQDALPAFLCAIFQPFTFSVANGIYVGVGMSFVLFFTTGTFLTYIPGLRAWYQGAEGSQRADTAAVVETKSESTASPAHRRLTRIRRAKSYSGSERKHSFASNQAVSSQVTREDTVTEWGEEEEEGGLRGALRGVGHEARGKACRLIEQAATLLGLDAEAVQLVLEERFEAARNVEGHAIGGVAAFETERLLQGYHGDSPHDSVGPLPLSEAPQVCAARLRRVAKSAPQMSATAEA